MGFKDILQRAKERRQEKKERFREMQDIDKLNTLLEERKKSSDLRELEGYYKEEEKKRIKEELDYMRKKRQNDINFNHNPINVKNITNSTAWEILKEKNIFKNKNIFMNQPSVIKSNNNLLKNNRRLYGI